MSFTWNTMGVGDHRVKEVDAFPTLEEVLANMATLAWEDSTNHLVDYVTDDERGEVVAVAIFGPEKELIVTISDGRIIRYQMPHKYPINPGDSGSPLLNKEGKLVGINLGCEATSTLVARGIDVSEVRRFVAEVVLAETKERLKERDKR